MAAAAFLQDVMQQPKNDYMRAAAIQSFEVSFELSWKYLQQWFRVQGLDLNSPREVIRQAFQANLIEDGAEWLRFADTRNLTTNTYRQQLADEVYDIVKSSFVSELAKLIETTNPNKIT